MPGLPWTANPILVRGYQNVLRSPSGPARWADDLTPIAVSDWSYDFAAHLLERAGFGGTPEEIARLAAMTPEQAVAYLVDYKSVPNDHLEPFDASGVWDPGLRDFPLSRVAATRRAERTGEALGVQVKPEGERRLQPVVDRFFYWLRATLLETRRLANWWGDRMVATAHPLEEKMALFWHGHFATGEEKVRDYRKMEQQLALLHRQATGNFRELLIEVARGPAMLVYLDAAQNVKGAPNENFAREVMELFTMGVGNYSEADIREAARAFTGWIDDDLAFKVDPAKHDDAPKTFLGRTGNFDGVDILRIILEQKVTAEYISAKLYRYFVREDISPAMQARLGAVLRDNDYEIAPLLRTIFLSRDFYSEPSFGTRIKGPIELVVSTYRKLGAQRLAGIPDLYVVSRELGQILLNPPTVAGWAQGRAWITPGQLLGARQFRPRRAVSRHPEFHRPELQSGRRDQAGQRPHSRRHGYPRGDHRARPGGGRRHGGRRYDDGERHRQRRGFQHPLRQPGRLSGGGPQDQADPAGGGAVRPLARRGLRRRKNRGRRRRPPVDAFAAGAGRRRGARGADRIPGKAARHRRSRPRRELFGTAAAPRRRI